MGEDAPKATSASRERSVAREGTNAPTRLDEGAGHLLVGRTGGHCGGDADKLVVSGRKAEVLHQSLAKVVDPGKDPASDAAVAVADRQAAIEQGRAAARTRTGDEQIRVKWAAGIGGGIPVAHLVVGRRCGLQPEAIQAVPRMAEARL